MRLLTVFMSFFILSLNLNTIQAKKLKNFYNKLPGNTLKINIWEHLYGNESLKSKNILFIEAIAKHIGLKKLPFIRKMNKNALDTFGVNNAFVLDEYLFISECFFELLTDEEKTFLIGHELTHYKKEHSIKKKILGTLSFTGAAFMTKLAICKVLDWEKKQHDYKRIKQGATCLGILAVWSGFSLANCAYSRACEKEADLDSIKKLDCAQGGIDFLNRFKWLKLNSKRLSWFDTHPTLNDRIAYLRPFLNKNLDKKSLS